MNIQNASKKPGKLARTLGLAGIGLCALCCALPIIGIVGASGVLAIVTLYAEKIAVIFLIISAASFAVWQYRKKRTAPACSIDCECKSENAETKSTTELKAR